MHQAKISRDQLRRDGEETQQSSNTSATIANWDVSLIRYYFVDYANGDDTRLGYIDAASGVTFAAGVGSAIALKTLEELRNRIPREGADRSFVVLVAPTFVAGLPTATTYFKKDGVTVDYLDRNYPNYRYAAFRVSDLTNSANDKVDLGGVISDAGPNADTSWTASGFAGFTVAITGALPIRDTLQGKKIRWKGNVTTALRTVGQMVTDRSDATHFDLYLNSAGFIPTANDEFFFVTPSVTVANIVDTGIGNLIGNNAAFGNRVPLVAGFRVSGTQRMGMGAGYFFCRFDGATTLNYPLTVTTSSYRDETLATISQIAGIDFRGTFASRSMVGDGPGGIQAAAFHSTTTILGWKITDGGSLLDGCCSTLTPSIIGCVLQKQNATSNPGGAISVFGSSSASIRPSRFVAGILIEGCDLTLGAIDCGGSTTGVAFRGINRIVVGTTIGPSGTTTGAYFDLSTNATFDSDLNFKTFGGVGTPDISLAGNVGMAAADLSKTNVVDSQGNNVQGSAGHVVDSCIQVTNKSGGALTVGSIVGGNGTTKQVTNSTGNAAVLANSQTCGVMVTSPANNAEGYMVSAGNPRCTFDGVPAMGATAYLSPGTPGALTTTIPAVAANNNKVRCGRVIQAIGAGNDAYVAWHPESVGIVADGLA